LGDAIRVGWSRGAHVIATVRGDVDEARRLGAEEVYDTKAVEVVEALRAAHPDGIDAVLDLVNGSNAIRRDSEILKAGGNLVSTLYAADERWFAERQITAHNIDAGGLVSTSCNMLEVDTITADNGNTAPIERP
jgi:NADPH:quinone reductase